ncbi:unnamed protein product [Closterium sp. Yama58-4]|nr:unnamed protein product [Closterium sp. Yama58-4]
MTTEVLDLFFQALPELELVTLFCQKAELPNSFFQLRRLHTFFLTDASAMQKPGFTNLTGLTTLHITFLMNHRHLSNLLHLPRLTRLFTSALHLSHQPAGAESVTLPSCLKSLSFFSSCSGFTTIFPSAWLFTALEELLISNCSELETLPDDIGDVLPCLRKLIIRQCKTSVHLPESFTLLSHLETLVISSVVTLALPSNFGHMPALKLLVLEKLHFTELPPSFCHLTSLETLFLVDCFNLQQLPAGFCSLTALKALCFSKTYRLALPEDVGALASLKALKLHACQEHPLPASFTQLSALTSLELNACRLGFPVPLPEALGELSRLQELKIIELSVATLPSSLIQLTRLQTLEVRGCRLLEEVPTRLDMLLGLKRLEMTACPRLTVPPAGLPPSLETLCLGPFWGASSHVVDISQLSHLRVLKLNRVGVTCGPAVASRLSCLEQLEQLEMRLGGDSCELPVPVTLISLCHLRSLLIDVPGLCSLPETMAAALPELRQLELRSWMPEELPGGILELRSLTSLSINAPRLTVVPQGMSRLIRLRILELIRCNALQHLPEFLTQLHRLILRDTPISSLPANRMPAD